MFGMDDDRVPSEMDSSSDTPYMRRSRAVAVRQSRIPQGIRRVAWWVGVICFVLFPLGVGGYLLGAYLLNSPRFQVTSPKDVVVEGNHYVSRAEILAALDIPPGASGKGTNIFRSSLDEREKEVESVSWVRSATVVRSYPHSLAVYVTERVPVAFVDVGGKIKMVDQEGALLDSPEKGHFDFPVVKGLDFQETPRERAARLNLYQQFMQETSAKMASSGWVVSEVDLSDASNLKALLVQGGQTLLVYFGSSGFLDHFENLMTVLPQLRKTNARIDSVDLRFRNQVVVNPVGGASSSAPSTGSGAARKGKGI
jgi:cell division septal protein FtsQ